MGALPRPDTPDGPLRTLSDRLHALHHRAGWPSLRDMAREVGCSHTTISVAFSEPRLPRWGLLELIVETLGGDTAEFHRLWLAASGDPPVPAPPGPAREAPVPRELPADVVAFTGRSGPLAELDALLDRPTSGVVIGAVSGTAGVGKTALAVHWAHRVAGRFPDGQLYTNLRGYDPDKPLTAAEALGAMLRVLGVAGPAIPHELPERAARYRTLLAGRRVLILLDNAHSVDQVRDLLPGTPSCLVLITSRDTLPALVARHGAFRINLDLLPPVEAHQLLGTLIGPRVDAEPNAAGLLAHRCARLPLALRIAAELAAARPAVPLAELAEELGNESRRLDLLAAGGDEYTAVRAVFSWSLRHLDEPAAHAFTLLGLHPGTDLDRGAIAALTDLPPPTVPALTSSLTRAHLLDDLGGGRYGRHDLLRAYAADRAGALSTEQRQAALTRLLDHYTTAAEDAAASESPAWLAAELANLLAVARAAGTTRHTVRLSAALAPYLDTHARYQDALELHKLARAAAARLGDPTAAAAATSALGTAYRRLGEYRHAEAAFRASLSSQQETGDRAGAAATRHGLGITYFRLGRYTDALGELDAALDRYTELGDRRGAATALYGLGITHFQLGHYAEAESRAEAALAMQRQVGDRTGEGRTLNNLGCIRQRLGDPAAARAHFTDCLAIAREVGNRTGEGVALANLGDLDVEQGNLVAAADEYEQALVLYRATGYRVGQADALRGLGVVCARLGQNDTALDHLGHAVALSAEISEPETEILARLDLGELLVTTGHPARAVTHLQAALTLAERTADPHAQQRARTALTAATGSLG
jgi:tetratricopeptide (TPR) repeat protein